MDNAPYHNARTAESLNPTTAWNKTKIQDWLSRNNILFSESATNKELLEITGRHRTATVYETDRMAELQGHKVLRLPVRHCELNPIELIQAQEKGFAVRNNMTFKLEDVKTLFFKAKETITPQKWADTVNHVINHVEAHFRQVDCLNQNQLEPVVILGDESDSDESSGEA